MCGGEEQDLFSTTAPSTVVGMVWDPFGTIGNALWLSGGQWAGKSTVARLLARRYGLIAYHHDYAENHSHRDREAAAAARRGETYVEFDPERHWVGSTVEEMADYCRAGWAARFEYTLDDLRALVGPRPVLAEGWGLRPDLVAPLLDSPRRMAVLVASEGFRQRQLSTLERAGRLSQPVSDPELGQRNRLARDRLLAEDVVRQAGRHGVRVFTVDGTADAEAMADALADHFAPYLSAAPDAPR